MSKGVKNLYIDCDPGIDDAYALSYLLTRDDLNIVGIGSVSGNVNIDKVNKNLQLIVSATKPDVKIFKGSSNFIIENGGYNAESYHGSDGLGEFWKSQFYESKREEIDSLLKKCFTDDSAVLEMIRLSKQYDNNLVILALGPLTNIAIAQLLDPLFGKRVKEILIMGGNLKGPGNSNVYIESEFNFSMDPEAVQIVFNKMECSKYIYPIDALGCPIVQKEYFKEWKNNSDVFKKLLEISFDFVSQEESENHFYDLILAIIVVHPEVIKKKTDRNVTIDLTGNFGRGHIIMDVKNNYTKEKGANNNHHKKFSIVTLIEELDEQMIIDFIKNFE